MNAFLHTAFWALTLLVGVQSGPISFADETHFKNVQQLTTGGVHSWPAFSDNGLELTFAAHGGPYGTDCDQVFRLNLADLSEKPARLSPGVGLATSPKFVPSSRKVTFQSNFHKIAYPDSFTTTKSCPVSACANKADATVQAICSKPTWDLVPNQDIFVVNEYGNLDQQLTVKGVFNGDGSIAHRDHSGVLVYYATRDDQGINLYTSPLSELTEQTLLTFTNSSYYGGIALSFDERDMAFHGKRPDTPEAKTALMTALTHNLIPADTMDIFTSSTEAVDPQLLNWTVGYTSFAPSFVNNRGNKLAITTNYQAADKNTFGIYMYNIDDESFIRLSTKTAGVSTKFAVANRNYNKIVFVSNRNGQSANDFNLFIADFNVTGTSADPFDDTPTAQPPRVMLSESAGATCWQDQPVQSQFDGIVHFPGEVHLKNVKQLTFGGQNAEGYFSFDDKRLTLQATGSDHYGTGCDQIYQLDLCKDPATQTMHRMSTGMGATTCSYFYPDNRQSLYAGTFRSVKINSTVPHDASCPMKTCSPDNPKRKTDPILDHLCNTSYTWDIYPEYDIYLMNEFGVMTKQLTDVPGYDAEGVLSPDGKMIAFTSMRHGDLDLYIMDLDGGNVRQITNVTGYDGGSFFSPDNKRLIFRASRPKTPAELQKYKQLLQYNIVEPVAMELFVVNVDGTGMHQITQLGGANWAPYYLADNKRVIFSSDHAASAQNFGAFDLFVINDDGTGLERVTMDDGKFDAFPMMNHAGTKLVWGSSRNGSAYDLNLFIADWVDPQQSSSVVTAPAALLTLLAILISFIPDRF